MKNFLKILVLLLNSAGATALPMPPSPPFAPDPQSRVFEVSIHQGPADWDGSVDEDVRVYSAGSRQKAADTQAVVVNEGSSAFVSMGSTRQILSGASVGWNTGVSYRQDQIQEGFYVVPQMQGSGVKLTIKRIRERQNPINQDQDQNAYYQTTVTVPLNQWTLIAAAAANNDSSSHATVSYGTQASFGDSGNLYVKVHQISPSSP